MGEAVGNPSVSVLIPAYNRVQLIEETLQSVLDQTYPNVELVVADDGSKDGTFELLQEFAKKEALTLLTHPGRANRGQAASLNLALKASKGSYIAVLDSDDIFLQDKLRHQVEFLERNPEVGLVYGMGEAIDGDGNWLYDILSPDHKEPNDPNEVLLDCYFLLPQNALVRREVYSQVGQFEESFRAAQDHDMLIRMAEVARFAFIPEKLFQYRRHSDSISSTGQERRWRTGFEILERARKRYPYKWSTIRKRRAVLNFRLGQTYWRNGARLKAIPHLVRSGLLDPIRAGAVLIGKEIIR